MQNNGIDNHMDNLVEHMEQTDRRVVRMPSVPTNVIKPPKTIVWPK